MAILNVFGCPPVKRSMLAVLALACLVSAFHPLPAQDMDVPVGVQVPILLKVISFDRQLRVRAPREVVVGVVMQGGNRPSVVARDEAVTILAARGTTVDGIPVRVVIFDLDRQSIHAMFANTALTHLYVTPLRAVDIRELAEHARIEKVITMTGVSDYLTRGLSVSVGVRGGRPRILVNVEASRAEGADLSAELLKLAELIP
jgi:hypothetical protein